MEELSALTLNHVGQGKTGFHHQLQWTQRLVQSGGTMPRSVKTFQLLFFQLYQPAVQKSFKTMINSFLELSSFKLDIKDNYISKLVFMFIQ